MVVLLPFLIFWDEQFWPNEETAARRAEKRIEMAQWRAAASSLAGLTRAPVLAPWWLSPATAYWSGQPTVAGSSHESLPGIVASARFYLATSADEAGTILRQHKVQWVLVYDGERVAENSASILGGKAAGRGGLPSARPVPLAGTPFSGPHPAERRVQDLSGAELAQKS